MSQSLFDLQFKQFNEYFLANRDQSWEEWLALPKEDDEKKKKSEKHSLREGKQGYVGMLQHPHNRNLTCLYKVSRVDDNLIEHEYKILRALEPLAKYCPHFHRAYGTLPFTSNVHHESECPLLYHKNSKQLKREMLLMQHIPHKYDFHDMIEDENIKDDLILNIMKQILLTLHLAQQYKFTHYDLHTENILIRNCNPNLHLLYILDDQHQFLLPTYGYIPNIIDFGFSFCEAPDNNLTCTLVHTRDGFTSARFDPFADLKLFFIATVDDIGREEVRKKIAPRLGNMTRNIFSGMNVSWRSGWDKSKQTSPVRIVHELVRDFVQESVLFAKSDLWFDTIQQLIDLPLNPMPYHDLEKACRSFIEEFAKFEERIISRTLLNYILRVFVQCVRTYRKSYLQGGEEGQWALIEIKKTFLEEYTQLVNFHVPTVDYEKMVCALLLMTQCIEGLFYDYLEKRYKEKDRQYEIMRCKTPLDFFYALEFNFPSTDRKPLCHKSQIFIIDHPNRTSKTLSLSKQDIHVMQSMGHEPTWIAQYLKNLYLATDPDNSPAPHS